MLLAVIAALVKRPADNFVNFDNDQYVYDNQHVMDGLTGKGIAWALTSQLYYWHPLTWLSLMAD